MSVLLQSIVCTNYQFLKFVIFMLQAQLYEVNHQQFGKVWEKQWEKKKYCDELFCSKNNSEYT